KIIEVKELKYQWHSKGNSFIANSTNPVHWDDEYFIMFIHNFLDPPGYAQRNRVYMQYAILISKNTLLPTSVIPYPLLIGGAERGRHPGVHYTMSLVNGDDKLFAFYGEADKHVGVVVFNRDIMNTLFKMYQLGVPMELS